jgi:flagellar basal body rod protein FlgB
MSESWMPIAGRPVHQELDRLWLNQQATAHNLANIQTPGFVGKRFVKNENYNFDNVLSKELARTDSAHLPLTEIVGSDSFSEQAVADLSPDSEMAEMSKTVVSYQTLMEIVVRQDRMARTAIEGR